MMMESVNDRKASANVDAFDDVGVPLGFERAAPQVHEEDDEDDEEGASRVPTMHFQMLTRKGNKGVNAHSLEVPLECNFAAKTLAKEQSRPSAASVSPHLDPAAQRSIGNSAPSTLQARRGRGSQFHPEDGAQTDGVGFPLVPKGRHVGVSYELDPPDEG